LSYKVFINLNNGVVGGEAQLCVLSENSEAVIGDVQHFITLDLDVGAFDELTPFCEVRKAPDWVSPLLPKKTTWRVLEVHRDKQTVQHFVVLCHDIWLHAVHRLR